MLLGAHQAVRHVVQPQRLITVRGEVSQRRAGLSSPCFQPGIPWQLRVASTVAESRVRCRNGRAMINAAGAGRLEVALWRGRGRKRDETGWPGRRPARCEIERSRWACPKRGIPSAHVPARHTRTCSIPGRVSGTKSHHGVLEYDVGLRSFRRTSRPLVKRMDSNTTLLASTPLNNTAPTRQQQEYPESRSPPQQYPGP